MPAERNGSHSTPRILNNAIVGARGVNRGLDQNILENFANIYIRNIDAILFKEQKKTVYLRIPNNAIVGDRKRRERIKIFLKTLQKKNQCKKVFRGFFYGVLQGFRTFFFQNLKCK